MTVQREVPYFGFSFATAAIRKPACQQTCLTPITFSFETKLTGGHTSRGTGLSNKHAKPAFYRGQIHDRYTRPIRLVAYGAGLLVRGQVWHFDSYSSFYWHRGSRSGLWDLVGSYKGARLDKQAAKSKVSVSFPTKSCHTAPYRRRTSPNPNSKCPQGTADWGWKGLLMFIHSLWTDEKGQDIAEYAVMLAVILVLVIGTIRLVGTNSNTVFSRVASSIQ